MEHRFPNGRLLCLVEGDITKFNADAIVNAANSALAGGGGVDGAIHRAGGPAIMEELNVIRTRQGGCPTGSAVVTGAGKLPARYVFHAVGPVWEGGEEGEAELLASCYSTCCRLAEENRARHVAFPSISTGVYGYPIDQAAIIALRTVGAHLATAAVEMEEATFVLFGERALRAYEHALAALF